MTTIITSMGIIAILAALSLLGVIVGLIVTIVTIPLQQQAEAAGCENSVRSGSGNGLISVNASKGRCFGH
jgi:hypothetical protein